MLAACGRRPTPVDAGPVTSVAPTASSFTAASVSSSAPTASPSASAVASASVDPDDDDDAPVAPASASAPVISSKPLPSSSAHKPNPKVPRCRLQKPLPFLVRGNYTPIGAHKELHDKAVRFRTEHYGYVKGFGDPKWNPHQPSFYAVDVKFLGLTAKMHAKVVPALACAEQAILKHCTTTPYVPGVLAGIRYENTYRGGEITNHAFAVAIDIDPGRNTCCNCVPPWRDHPLCKKKLAVEQRMAMPMCWVKQFERYGWYWLGHDKLEDTMHFEFLGDPDRILLGK